MQKLGILNFERVNVKNQHMFQTNPNVDVKSRETMKVILPVYIEDVKKN